MKYEIKNLFRLPSGTCLPCSLNIWQQLWWHFVPGEVVNVAWPVGEIMGASNNIVQSADPNDHYRPWLEEHVGRQGIHWNWGVASNDIVNNRLTIKIIKSKSKYATILAMRWA